MPRSSLRQRLLATVCVLASGCSALPPAQHAKVGGAQIAWVRTGSAGPTVVLQSGLGDGMSPWAAVMDRLPSAVATVAYDRPGYGASGPAPTTPRTPCDVAHELHELLSTVGAQPPYLLVGHSLGGQYQYAYALLFPQDVAGMLLLDPTHPDHWTSLQREAPLTAATIAGLRATVFSPAMRAEFDGQAQCLGAAPSLTKPIPTRVLVSTRAEIGESSAFQAVVARLRVDWLTKLPGATLLPVDGAGHYIQRDQPERVAAEVRSMFDEVSRSLASRERPSCAWTPLCSP